MKGGKYIKEIIKSIFIICLLIILLNICYSKFIKKDELIKVLGKSFLIVVTGSMEPTIEAGELIIISDEEVYKEGDIISYIDDDNYIITHRIVEINSKEFITKGDGNNIEDEKNNIDNIKGKVIFHSKLLGFFVMYLLKPITILYIIIFIIVNLIRINGKKFNNVIIKNGTKNIERNNNDDKKENSNINTVFDISK